MSYCFFSSSAKLFAAITILASSTLAQAAESTLSPEAQYKSCPLGYYGGPRQGRTRYTQDPWFWSITQQFSEKFCFPAEMVDKEFSGADAVAVRRDADEDQIVCTATASGNVCRPAWVYWSIDLYLPGGKIPMANDAKYYYYPELPSNMVWSHTDKGMHEMAQYHAIHKRPGAENPFGRISLFGLHDGKIVWPVGALSASIYFSHVQDFHDLDYLELRLPTGRLNDARMQGKEIDSYVIAFHSLSDTAAANPTDLTEFPYLVYIPKSLIEKMRPIDQAETNSLIDSVKKILGTNLK